MLKLKTCKYIIQAIRWNVLMQITFPDNLGSCESIEKRILKHLIPFHAHSNIKIERQRWQQHTNHIEYMGCDKNGKSVPTLSHYRQFIFYRFQWITVSLHYCNGKESPPKMKTRLLDLFFLSLSLSHFYGMCNSEIAFTGIRLSRYQYTIKCDFLAPIRKCDLFFVYHP